MNTADQNYCLFLTHLLTRSKLGNISDFSKKTAISRRMIYYYLEKLNEELLEQRISPVEKETALSNLQREQIETMLVNISSEEIIFTPQERQLILSVLILTEKQKWQLKHFQDLLQVSRNTLLKDILVIKEFFQASDIELLSSKARGYYLDCEELTRRQMLYQYLYVAELEKQPLILSFLLSALDLGENATSFVEYMRPQIERITRTELGKELSKQDVYLLAQLLLFTYFRSQKQEVPVWSEEEENMIRDRFEYRTGKQIVETAGAFLEIDYCESDALYMGMLLLCVKKNSDDHFQADYFKNLLYLTETFIDLFEKMSGILFVEKSELIEKVQTHMKVVFFQHIFDMKIFADLNEQLIDHKIYQITEKVADLIKSDMIFQICFPNGFRKSDLCNFTLYFEEAINKNQLADGSTKVIIVSDYPDVMNSLIHSHVKKLLVNVDVEGIFHTDEAPYYPRLIDYCVTTAANYIHPLGETITVNGILTPDDKRKISALNYRLHFSETKKDKLVQILAKNGVKNPDKELLQEIFQLFEESLLPDRIENIADISIQNFLMSGHTLISEAETVNEVVTQIAQQAVAGGYAVVEYFDKIAEEVAAGHLTFLQPGVLLLQTDSRYGSLQPCMYFALLKKPIQWKSDQEIRLVALIVTEAEMSHLPLLFELDELLQTTFLSRLFETNDFIEAYENRE